MPVEPADQILELAQTERNGKGAYQVAPRDAPASDLFRRYTMAELLAEPDDFSWLVLGLLADLTYGQLAGPMKVLKSYLLAFIQAGVASGVPIFGQFEPVGSPRGVLAYIGEGGRAPWVRRFKRVCAAMGINPADLDLLNAVFDIAPIPSLVFQESLRRDINESDCCPLVTVDPLYAYHGVATRSSDLHQEGALLNLLSGPCIEAEASLIVVNHFNQTGSGSSLKRITMAGSGEWADSWLLLDHRESPDVENGLFRLTLEIGSRQWGGATWNLDLDIGRFDVDTGTHDGQICWDISRSNGTKVKAEKATASQSKAEKLILDTIADHPWEKTKTEIKVLVGGSKDAFEAAFNDLAERDVIAHGQAGREEAGTTKKRLLWGMASTKAESGRPDWRNDAF